MTQGTIFDIKEFAVYDGPGIRTTVFMKGCPLRCKWCHNPEGLSVKSQLMVSTAACVHCDICKQHCTHSECIACGECIPYCKAGLRRMCGTVYAPDALAERLLKDEQLWKQTDGGVTFSGGEPLLQWDFVREVIYRLPGVHTAIETSGYAAPAVFREALDTLSFVMMDLKHMDSKEHKRWTGVENALILRNAGMLLKSSVPCVIRIPVIPGVNDSEENLSAAAAFVAGSKNLVRVELLPYHQTAGAKYPMAGMPYMPGFDETALPNADPAPFEKLGISVKVL